MPGRVPSLMNVYMTVHTGCGAEVVDRPACFRSRHRPATEHSEKPQIAVHRDAEGCTERWLREALPGVGVRRSRMEKLIGSLNTEPRHGRDVLCLCDRRNDRVETEAAGHGYRRFDHQIRVLSHSGSAMAGNE